MHRAHTETRGVMIRRHGAEQFRHGMRRVHQGACVARIGDLHRVHGRTCTARIQRLSI
jgi:hypothetical protein